MDDISPRANDKKDLLHQRNYRKDVLSVFSGFIEFFFRQRVSNLMNWPGFMKRDSVPLLR